LAADVPVHDLEVRVGVSCVSNVSTVDKNKNKYRFVRSFGDDEKVESLR